jgi:hypothetical protein
VFCLFFGWCSVFGLRQGERDCGAGRVKACRWVLVGSVSIGKVTWVPVNRTWFAAQGGEVVQQAAEAAVEVPGWVVLAGGFGLGGRGAAGLGDRVVRGGRVLVGEGERGQGPGAGAR